jgi:hypothetical protein
MTTSNLTKTIGTSYQAWQSVATANVIVGSAVTVTNAISLTFGVAMGRAGGTAFTVPPQFRIEGALSSAEDSWSVIDTINFGLGASIANTTLNGAVSAGAGSCTVTSATNVAAGDLLFLGHTTDTTKYEIVRVKSVSGTTVTFEENCVYAHDSGAAVTDQAEHYRIGPIDLSTDARVRGVIVNHSGQTANFRSMYSTLDSIATA